MKNYKYRIISLALLLLIISLFSLSVKYYGDWLWFQNMAYSSVFDTNILTQILSFLLFFSIFILFSGTNVYYAYRSSADKKIPVWVWGSTILFFAFIMGSYASDYWIDYLKFLNPSSFNLKEPIYGKDAGFYLFTLPVYQILLGWYFTMLVFTTFFVLLSYYIHNNFNLQGNSFKIGEKAKGHLLLLGAFFTLGISAHYFIQLYNILYSSNGVAYGPSYMDVHAQIPAYWTIIILTLILTLFLFFYPLHKRLKLLVFTLLAWVMVQIGFVWIYPSMVEQYIVKPNELEKETPYIANNIKFTTKAYGLDRVTVKPFSIDEHTSYKDILENHNTIENIRLWDRRPLIQTYKQLQEIRLYYDFKNIQVDRYHFPKYTEVALGARELPASEIPYRAQTWVNKHLIYTHGYGVVMNPVNEITSDGMPNLVIKDIPPVSTVPLKLTQMGIYYGEKTDQYVLVNTKAKEFDYPKGDKNVYTSYKGDGGVQISSLFKRFVYAWKFSDINILFTSYLTKHSRIMFYRNITQRAATLAPFLEFDRQPYSVVGDNGKLYWMQDAYTTSNMFPYSEPMSKNPIKRDVNYIKNSVKVVIDAYNGDVSFYVIDPTDPLL